MEDKRFDKRYKLSSDIFIRASVISKIIELVKKGNPKILDVGGYQGMLDLFVKKDVKVIDVFDVKEKNYIKGDARKINFPDNYFDVVTCIETLEHIKEEDREKVINELVRVSKDLVILACPVYSVKNIKAEKFASKFFKEYMTNEHPWLKEHESYGLPKEQLIHKKLSEKLESLQVLDNHLVFYWLEMILLHFFDVITKEEFSPKIRDLYTEFNINLASKRPNGSVYRKIFVGRKFKPLPDNLLDKVYDSSPSIYDKWKFNYKITKFFNDHLGQIKSQKPSSLLPELKEITKEIESNDESFYLGLNINLIKILNRVKRFKNLVMKIPSIFWRVVFKISSRSFPGKSLMITLLKIVLPEKIKSRLRAIRSRRQALEGIIGINTAYQTFFKAYYSRVTREEIEKNLKRKPRISLLMPVYNTNKNWLKLAIESVLDQAYDNWELCIVDDFSNKKETKEILNSYKDKDKRIKIKFRTERGNISQATNNALKMATGEYIGLLDHDDELSPNALSEVVKVLNDNPNIDLIYSDEDKIDSQGNHCDPYFKPDWSPDMILSNMYTSHFSVYRTSIVEKIGGFRLGFEGSQDYDLVLRFSEVTKKIYHIPKILYHWRKLSGSTAEFYQAKGYAHDSAKKALEEAIQRRALEATLEKGLRPDMFRVKYKISKPEKVSIIIPTRDKADLLERCVNSILEKTDYPEYEIVIIDNGSSEEKTLNYFRKAANNPRIKVINYKKPFNYAEINDYGASKTSGKYLLFLNNDTEVINKEWLSSMVEHGQRDEVGVVGAKLLYPKGYIQHVGVVLGIGGVAGHVQKWYPDKVEPVLPIFNNKDMVRNWSCVTAACMLVRRDVFEKAKGFDPTFRIAYNDVDFCLRVRKLGLLIVYTPYAKLFHHESASVGPPGSGRRNLGEFLKENHLMKKRWGDILLKDPYYNTNLTLEREDYSLGFLDSQTIIAAA